MKETTTELKTELKTEIKKSLALLQTLRDEIRVKIHLAGLDAKDTWKELETQLVDASMSAGNLATEATRTAVDEAVKKLRKFRASLH